METGFRKHGKRKPVFDADRDRGRKFTYDFGRCFAENQGALALLQKSVLDEAKKKIGESFYMLPVSILS